MSPPVLLLIVAILFSLGAQAQPLTPAYYAVPDVNWEPYWIIEEGQARGILGELMQALDEQTQTAMVASEPLPVKRNQVFFDKGELVLECCVNEAWRDKNDENGVSLWSDAVLSTHELVVVHPAETDFVIEQASDLKGKAVATILGYGYKWDAIFQRFDVTTNLAQLNLVALRRVDVAIIDEYEFRYLLGHNEPIAGMRHDLKSGARIGSSELKIRIHSSRPDLLLPVNKALARLKEEGAIDALIQRYIQ